jgi:hypothetical protein
MVLKEFTLKVPEKGRVDVSFYLHFDDPEASVGEIKIHTDYDSTLPRRAWLKKNEADKWKLYDDHPALENKEIVVKPEFLDDDVSNEIVKTILAIKQGEIV